MKCCVPLCENSSENIFSQSNTQGITFYEIPTFPLWLKESWMESIGINEKRLQHDAVVCSQHFQNCDFIVTRCGNVKLRTNSVPSIIKLRSNSVSSTVHYCIVCLATDGKLYQIDHHLADAYMNITGLTNSLINSESRLCMECCQRLLNCYKFKKKSLLAHNLLLKLVEKHGKHLRCEKIKTINRVDYQLTSNLLKHNIKPDHCDLYLIDEEDQSKLESVFKTEENENPISEAEVKKEYLDFEIDVDYDNNVNKDTEHKNINKDYNNKIEYSNDDIDNDVMLLNEDINSECLKEDTNHDVDFFEDCDSYEKILNNNIDNRSCNNDGKLLIPRENAKIKVSPSNVKLVISTKHKIQNKNNHKHKVTKQKQLDDNMKNKVSIKEAISNTKKKAKLNKDPPNDKNERKTRAKKTQVCNKLKLFDVTVLNYEEQLADIQKRKETVNYKKSPHTCNICYKGYNSSISYNRHMEKHTNKYGQYECAICGLHVKNRTTLFTHIKGNHDVRYNCKSCPFVSNLRKAALAHEQWHSGKKFVCTHCKAEFAKRTTYFSHVRIKHPSDFVCSLCGYSFISEVGLRQHSKIIHRFNETQESEGPTCEECNIRFASGAAYQQHIKVSPKHAVADTLQRNALTVRYSEPKGIYSKRKKRVADVLCEFCGKAFICRATLQLHMQVHTGEKLYKCHFCEKTFMHKPSYTAHLATHTGNPRLYECAVCGRTFTNYSNRQRHMRSHSDTRPYYKCEVCDKNFTTTKGRNEHVLHVHHNVPRPKRVRSARPSPKPGKLVNRHE